MSIGEYETPGASLTQWHARAFFLKLLPKLAPKAVKELTRTLLHSFQSTKIEAFSLIKEWKCIQIYSACDSNFTDLYPAEQVKFYQELTAWTERHHLTAPWIIEPIILALDWWTKYPQELGKRLESGLEHSETWYGEEEPFRFEYPEWRYRELSEHEYRQAIKEHFMEQLNLYLTGRSLQAMASGDQQVKHTRESGKINPTIKMQWFILYQVKELCANQILDRYTHKLPDSATPKQISNAVREISALIGLPLRKASRGRPKKQE